jgi:hypothetical protein
MRGNGPRRHRQMGGSGMREAMQQPAKLEAQEEARATRAMVLVSRVACNKEGNGNSNEGNKGDGQVMERWQR